MGEALEALSSHTPKGSDWPYVLIQSYKGTNHMHFSLKIGMFVSYPREKWKAQWADKPIKNLPSSYLLGHCQLFSPWS